MAAGQGQGGSGSMPRAATADAARRVPGALPRERAQASRDVAHDLRDRRLAPPVLHQRGAAELGQDGA
ncbi:hypothetical protein [Singulisphaera sp. PoT]|uniref:hypothetical protein n=1 Tax=Singulisphaera sp. PoT TaxID=3411797 RepID=UPI003BF5FE1B